MNHLVMAQDKDKFLRILVDHTKCQHAVPALAEQGICADVFQIIVHPAHIPLEVEAQPLLRCPARNLGPGGGLLRDGECAILPCMDLVIHSLDEGDRLQVLIAAINIGHPSAVTLPIIEIEHGCHSVHAKSVGMEFLQPVERIGNKEIHHLRPAVIVDQGPPVRMLALSRIKMLK